MGLFTRIRWQCALLVALLAPAVAQDTPHRAELEHPVAAATSDAAAHLPSWLDLGLELRGVAELQSHTGETEGGLLLGRTRLTASVRPTPWLQVVLQGQDARAAGFSGQAGAASRRNPLDIRQAYLDLGGDAPGWRLRLGRQELALADERLLAADNEWDPFGPSFDAIRLSYGRGRLRAEAFSAMPVTAGRRPDRADTSSRISGVALQWSTGDKDAVVEPYLLWSRADSACDLLAHPGRNETVTTGFRAQGPLPSGWEYNLEMALQRGRLVRDPVSAWAGHWELAWSPGHVRMYPRLVWEYNFSSGDSDPEDGRHTSFDDLYSAGYNDAGIPDPFAWRNIRNPGVTLELKPAGRWQVSGGWRSFWLADVRDAVYPGSVGVSIRNPGARSSHLGNQVFVGAAFSRSERWRFGAGYGHLFSGQYMLQSGQASSMRTLYLLSVLRF